MSTGTCTPGYNSLRKHWRGMLSGLNLDPAKVYRCGPYRIKPVRVQEKEVTFKQTARVTFHIEEAV